MSADFVIVYNASGGNRSVKVTVGGQTSGSGVNFYVQIPSKLIPLNDAAAPSGIGPLQTPVNGDVVALGGAVVLHNVCGVYRNYLFQLVDQDSPAQPIAYRPYLLDEIFTSYSSPNGLAPPTFVQSTIGTGTNPADIQFLGFFYPNCLTTGDNQTFTQQFAITINSHTYYPTTTIVINRGLFSPHSVLKVDRTITTP
jgi:hypothetical protein